MNNSELGVKGESLVLNHFVQLGYEVYLPFGGKSIHDLIVVKDGILQSVQVKTTKTKAKSGDYIVQLRRIRSNTTKTIVYNFDSSQVDLLAVVLIPESKVIILKASSVKSKTKLNIKAPA